MFENTPPDDKKSQTDDKKNIEKSKAEPRSKPDLQQRESAAGQGRLSVDVTKASSAYETYKLNETEEKELLKNVCVQKGRRADVKMTTFHGIDILKFDVQMENILLRKRNDFLQDQLMESKSLITALKEHQRVTKQENEELLLKHKNEKAKILETLHILEEVKQKYFAEKESLNLSNKTLKIRLKTLEKEREDLLTR